MIHVDQLFEPRLLSDMLEQGFVRERRHTVYPYRILNYTETAAYEGLWNDVTRQCRGLVINDEGSVIARPFEKFHNHSEHDGQKFPALDLNAPVTVTDKLDGSLGILVPKPDDDGYIIATRGSFESEQARWATAFYNEHYANDALWQPEPGFTYLFEIVFSSNRIVIDYDFEDLVLLGGRNIETGKSFDPRNSTYPGPSAEVFPSATLAEALALPPRQDAEGLVVLFDNGERVKIKQDDYLRLHKLVTGLNERAVWEHMAAGLSFEALIEGIPDEFHRWVTDVWDAFWTEFDSVSGEAIYRYMRILSTMDDRDDRKEFASLATKQGEYAPLMFLLYDSSTPRFNEAIWKRLRPVGDTRMWNQPSEAA